MLYIHGQQSQSREQGSASESCHDFGWFLSRTASIFQPHGHPLNSWSTSTAPPCMHNNKSMRFCLSNLSLSLRSPIETLCFKSFTKGRSDHCSQCHLQPTFTQLSLSSLSEVDLVLDGPRGAVGAVRHLGSMRGGNLDSGVAQCI